MPQLCWQISSSLGWKMPTTKPTVRTTSRTLKYIPLTCNPYYKISVTLVPQALRFYGSSNVIVTGITIQNSPLCHLKFDNCIGVSVFNMRISSPGDSPNTDGIHLQNSQNVLIRNTNLACGNFLCTRVLFLYCLLISTVKRIPSPCLLTGQTV